MGIEEKKRDQKVDKLIESVDEFVSSAKSFLKVNNISNNTQVRDRFMNKKDLTSDFLKKNNKLLDKILKVSEENLNVNKKKSGSFLKGLGGLLALGGLAGYLLTGKTEHLMNLAKGFLKYLSPKFLLKPIEGILKGGIELLGKGLKGFFDLDIIAKPLKGLFGFVEGIGKSIAPISKLFGKESVKEGAKIAGKGASKSFLKKVPVLGAVIGLFFGIEKFKKKDYVGGAAEIASGIASMFPGLGTAVSFALDGLIMLNDFNVFGDVNQKAANVGSTIKNNIKDWPVIGSIVSAYDAMANFVKDPVSAAMDLANSADSFIPGSGEFIRQGVGWVQALKDSMPAKFVKKGLDKVKDAGSKILSKFGLGKGDPFVNFIQPKMVSLTENVKDKVNNITNSGTIGPNAGIRLADSKVDLSGLQKSVYDNFIGMASEYFDKTNESIQVNSAFRSIEEQKRLYNTLPKGMVAYPGKSMHNYGYAIDINSKTANKLNSMGLMNKWKFQQPLKSKEPWHIEPTGIDRKGIRSSGVEEGKQIGDPVSKGELNQNNAIIKNRRDFGYTLEKFGKDVVVKLSDETIAKLAEKIAEEGKVNVTTFKNKQAIVINSRG